jgi:hypothetical protein
VNEKKILTEGEAKLSENWEEEELIPTWWPELDINFIHEYGLMGNVLEVRVREGVFQSNWYLPYGELGSLIVCFDALCKELSKQA